MTAALLTLLVSVSAFAQGPVESGPLEPPAEELGALPTLDESGAQGEDEAEAEAPAGGARYSADEMAPMTPAEIAKEDAKAKSTASAPEEEFPAPVAKPAARKKVSAKGKKVVKAAPPAAAKPAAKAIVVAKAPKKVSAVPLTPVAPFNP
jgi:hypothetical protein